MLRSDLVNHLDFHKGYWYKSNISDWYYFKHQDRPYEIYKKFEYSSLDNELISLVKSLHKKNIPTTPSCSGHSLSEDYFLNLFEQIKIEEYLIRNKGLKLRNIETQETLEFKDFRYKFPYDRDTFLKLAIPYSKHGVLGTLKDFSYIDNIEGLDISRDGDITLFYAKNGSEKIWNDLETAITLIWDS